MYTCFGTELKMAAGRIQIASNKKSALMKQQKREVAILLSETPPKEEKARIRAEALIRDDGLVEAYEILQLNCELLHERIKLLASSKICPLDMIPTVATIMWASRRVDIPELTEIRKQFRAKFGKEFDEMAMTGKGTEDGKYSGKPIWNPRVVEKLSVEPPPAYHVQTYLQKICEEFDVKWEPMVKLTAEQSIRPTEAPSGYSVQPGTGSGLGGLPNIDLHNSTSKNTIPVVTGVPDTDQEILYQKQQSLNGTSPYVNATIVNDPPKAPSGFPGSGNATKFDGTRNNSHVAEATLYTPSSDSPIVPSMASYNDDLEEVDIYVPGGSAKQNSPAKKGIGSSAGAVNSSNGSGSSSTYEDLLSRFDSLKK
jgi:hypothetical protein